MFECLTKNELIHIAKILGVPTARVDTSKLVEKIVATLQIRHKIYTTKGVKVYVRMRPRYSDGWVYCSKCELAYKSVNGGKLTRCPVCNTSLRHKGLRKHESNG